MSGVKGRGGRPRDPTVLKALRGTLRPDRTNPEEPRLDPGLPDPPEGLTPKECSLYWTIGERVLELGVMTPPDQFALALLACTYARWLRLKTRTAKEGEIGEAKRAPWAIALDVVARQLSQQFSAFGLDPSGRARVKVTKAKPKETDRAKAKARFFGRAN